MAFSILSEAIAHLQEEDDDRMITVRVCIAACDETRELRSRQCKERLPVVKKPRKHRLHYKKLRREGARGAAVMQAFNTVREPANPAATPPLPEGQACRAFYHGWLHRKTGLIKFFFDDESCPGRKLETFEGLLGGPAPEFLAETVPLITARLSCPTPLWKHKYLDSTGAVRTVVLVGRV